MGPASYMRSVVDRNVVIRRIPVLVLYRERLLLCEINQACKYTNACRCTSSNLIFISSVKVYRALRRLTQVTCMTDTVHRASKIKHASKETKYPRLRSDISSKNTSLWMLYVCIQKSEIHISTWFATWTDELFSIARSVSNTIHSIDLACLGIKKDSFP